MDTPAHDTAPHESQSLEIADKGILHELGGRWGWRYWWPLVFWLVDALSVATVRSDATTEPSGVLLITSYIAVVLIWVLGARPAIWHGHNRRLVRMWATVASLAVSVGAMAVGAVARVAEATMVGNENARIFITTDFKEVDHTVWFGFAEHTYLYYGLPILVVLILVCWFLVGLGHRRRA